MSMRDAIKNFYKQFEFEPKVGHYFKWQQYEKFVVCGMGGSHLAADLLKVWNPKFDIVVHSDYGLPPLHDSDLKNRLIIISSYSGNTEEALDAYHIARMKELPLAAMSIGGKLLILAKSDGFPYVELPNTGIQPRSALGFSLRALLKLMGQDVLLEEVEKLAKDLRPLDLEKDGKSLAERLRGRIPVIYSSTRNASIAYNWKIKFNETGKIPAFYNVIPEMNHNEMTGFDLQARTNADIQQARTYVEKRDRLNELFYFTFLKDPADEERIQKRMEVTARLLEDRKLPIETIGLDGLTVFEKIFSSLVLADWTAYYLAESYGVDPEQVPMVEEFKKLVI